MKPHLPTALRRALLAALAVAALAPAAWAETFTLTQDTSYKCGEGDWSLGAAFKSENTAVSYKFTSNPENKYSLSFSGGTAGVFYNNSGGSSFDYLTFTQLNELSFSGNESGSLGGAIYSRSGDITLSGNTGDITFSGNIAGYEGGAIYNFIGTITLSKNSGTITFSDNESGSSGGAIFGVISLSKNIGDIEFSGNHTESHGGAIYSFGGAISLTENGAITFSGIKQATTAVLFTATKAP